MIKKAPLSPDQDMAANPRENVWVQANAGTGKTSVLTERLLRILFRTDNITKSGILCLTYTNAGAGEMRNRILQKLTDWALLPDSDLQILLDDITTNKPVTNDDIAHAREIFFTYIDNPNMLKIKTIHGFCEEILHRFPLEANISPAWKLVSDNDQHVLLWNAFNNMILTPKDKKTEDAFSHILNCISEYTIDNLLNILSTQYKHFFHIKNVVKYREYFIEQITQFLNLNQKPNTHTSESELQNIIYQTQQLQQNNKKAPQYLQQIITNTQQYLDNSIDFEQYKYAYLTKTGEKIKNISKIDFLINEQERVFKLNQFNENTKIFNNTVALFDLSAAFTQNYLELKRSHNILDFEDLILYTRKLFSDADTMGWVLSQMDISLSHILVDEAQDTSPEQWDIIRMLTGDFFDNGDTSDLPRSLFIVGDTKQSIYGFQGADPNAFIKSRQDIAQQIENNYRVIRDIPLDQNFRSLPSILYTVDTFFQDKTVCNTSNFINQQHKCFRQDKGLGIVELHKLNAKQITGQDVQYYIKTVANKIKTIIDSGRPAHDIMVLVQNRKPFASPLVNELKKMNINVAGSDRITLPNFPAIRDLLNLVRFCLDNTDDYSLCCVLKSPLYRFSESDIYNLCKEKQRIKNDLDSTDTQTQIISIYNILEKYNNTVYQDLFNLIQESKKLSPYSFFSYVLHNNNSRQKMISALGNQIIDPLEEFMTICLSYERTRPGTLKDFLKWFITSSAEIKRDMDSASGVRIVTVHGSKGLESPIVFLIDTVRTPDTDAIINIPITQNTDLPAPWLWLTSNTTKTTPVQSALNEQKNLQIAEYYRLLYVAMTRARDELYIYGYTTNKNPNELSWHANLWRVFSKIYNTSENSEYIRIEHE